eukprot:TRINITY_DN4635_c0_g2_i8.p1 TRINITY_DN4635_c0_g2~~TRINITY_DN4635_c0_g2_i8.p1  ORF type:complete len:246 (+),score=21.74 TRINITY_DN4635_c0_g2_i8:155-892(+)
MHLDVKCERCTNRWASCEGVSRLYICNPLSDCQLARTARLPASFLCLSVGSPHSLVDKPLHVGVLEGTRHRMHRPDVSATGLQPQTATHRHCAKALWQAHELVAIQVETLAHCECTKARWQGRQLVAGQPQVSADSEGTKALRQAHQLVGVQLKMLAEFESTKVLRQAHQLVVIQVQILAHCERTKALRQARKLVVGQTKMPPTVSAPTLSGRLAKTLEVKCRSAVRRTLLNSCGRAVSPHQDRS